MIIACCLIRCSELMWHKRMTRYPGAKSLLRFKFGNKGVKLGWGQSHRIWDQFRLATDNKIICPQIGLLTLETTLSMVPTFNYLTLTRFFSIPKIKIWCWFWNQENTPYAVRYGTLLAKWIGKYRCVTTKINFLRCENYCLHCSNVNAVTDYVANFHKSKQ